MLIYIIFLLALNKNTFKIHSNYILIKYGRFFHLKLCKLLLGEKTVIFINSCIKFAALCGISGPAAYEPAHFFDSFLCASKEMKNNFYYAFRKS